MEFVIEVPFRLRGQSVASKVRVNVNRKDLQLLGSNSTTGITRLVFFWYSAKPG
jgi:hypothetical protein